tara:strand:+ start:349 stop:612 length:264 start_codon:yes stop_codon:yes gene_type:complete
MRWLRNSNEKYVLALIVLIAVVVLVSPNHDLGETTSVDSLFTPKQDSQGLFYFFTGHVDSVASVLVLLVIILIAYNVKAGTFQGYKK